MNEFEMFENFLIQKEANLETVEGVKQELHKNETALKEALQMNQFTLMCNLKTQRDALKDILIDLLEKKAA